MYWNQALSTYEIADRFDLSQMSIWSYLKRMNIPRCPARKRIKRKPVDTLSGGDELKTSGSLIQNFFKK